MGQSPSMAHSVNFSLTHGATSYAPPARRLQGFQPHSLITVYASQKQEISDVRITYDAKKVGGNVASEDVAGSIFTQDPVLGFQGTSSPIA